MPKKGSTTQDPGAPFDDFGFVQACRELHAAIDHLDASVAKAVGIARSDLRCLNLLEGGPRSPSEIARSLELTTGSVTALLDRLESLGLVERRRSSSDRRALLICATQTCFQTVGPIYRRFAESLIDHANGQTPRNRTVIVAALRDIAQLCREASPKEG